MGSERLGETTQDSMDAGQARHDILTPTVVDGANGAAWWQNDKAGDGPGGRSDGVSGLDRVRGRSPWHLQTGRTPALGVSAAKAVPAPVFTDAAGKAWVKTPVDAFVLAALRKQGLRPAAAADRASLIRRATYDMHGLPPTPEEVDAFVADRSPKAWEKVVDRLLASPRYGEQWGHHWLDVVRFAESDGYEYDTHRPDAWRYRDYVMKL